MIIDKLLMFAELCEDIISAATILMPKSVDLGVVKGSQALRWPDVFIRIDTAFTGGYSFNFQLICSDTAALGTPTVLVSTGVILRTALPVGTMLRLRLPDEIPKRYLGLQVVATAETGTDWAATTAYAANVLKVVTSEDTGTPEQVWKVTTAGTTGESEPAWKIDDSPITDGTAVWTYQREALPTAGVVTAGMAEMIPTGAF